MTTLRTRRRCLQALASLGCASGMVGCAAIIHPERQGNPPGPIDVAPLILDILWFIPGLVPGIIALAVDFGTGAIYLDRRARAGLDGPRPLAISPGERITVRAPRPDERVAVALRLVGPRGAVLDEARGRWSPAGGGDLGVALPRDQPHALGDARLELVLRRRGVRSTAAYPLHLRPSLA
jgi:hypothetical protein